METAGNCDSELHSICKPNTVCSIGTTGKGKGKRKRKRKGKGKAITLQAWTGPEGSRTLRLPDFKTIRT
jgi:hypothetical protein